MPRLLSILIVALVLAACRPPAYVQPTETEPHALLKIRHVVHAQRGPIYGSSIRLGEFAIDERTIDPAQTNGGMVHVRIRPEYGDFGIFGTSYHYEMRTVTRYRTVQESYSCSQQECSTTGYGSSARQSCRSVTRQCTRSRQESYQATESVVVTDDACGQRIAIAPRIGAVYLVQFDYLGENECRLSCFEQTPSPDGQFTLTPCPAVIPPAP